jgi:hypothetical protein
MLALALLLVAAVAVILAMGVLLGTAIHRLSTAGDAALPEDVDEEQAQDVDQEQELVAAISRHPSGRNYVPRQPSARPTVKLPRQTRGPQD